MPCCNTLLTVVTPFCPIYPRSLLNADLHLTCILRHTPYLVCSQPVHRSLQLYCLSGTRNSSGVLNDITYSQVFLTTLVTPMYSQTHYSVPDILNPITHPVDMVFGSIRTYESMLASLCHAGPAPALTSDPSYPTILFGVAFGLRRGC